MIEKKLAWQSKLVLLVVLPFVGADVVLETHWWAGQQPSVATWTLGLSALLGLVTWKLRAATPYAAVTGAAITAQLMFATASFPYAPWRTALIPVLAVALLAHFATRMGHGKKERLGTAEARKGRSAAQVAANLGMAALLSTEAAQLWLLNSRWSSYGFRSSHGSARASLPLFAAVLAALCEAAADTVSSETGQVFGGRPRMITTLRSAEPGTDGAISLMGTLAGISAAAIVAALGTFALRGNAAAFAVGCAGGVFGLFFDSLLGATLEARGWLNNDAVNFLSTAGAAAFALGILSLLH